MNANDLKLLHGAAATCLDRLSIDVEHACVKRSRIETR